MIPYAPDYMDWDVDANTVHYYANGDWHRGQ